MTKKIRVGIHISRRLHRNAKATAYLLGSNLSAVVSALLRDWVEKHNLVSDPDEED